MTIRHEQIQGVDSLHLRTIRGHRRPSVWAGLLIILTLAFFAGSAVAKTTATQKTFGSPDDALQALVAAVKNNNDKELVAILGPGSGDLISSGDKVDDKMGKERFLKSYEEKNSIEASGDNKAVIHIGSQDRIFPIPVVKKGNRWLFDTKAGKEEILCRRVGRNELNVMDVLNAYSDAQREYASKDRNGNGILEFAQRLISTKGKKDGLYWDAKEGEDESPFGPLVAKASAEGYKEQPFHGYYFKIIKAQGPHAKGGAFDYVARGHMVLGFGLLAYPAKYGSSGIMTFMVNQEGVIYQKDLGRNTGKAVTGIRYDPDKTWKKAEEVPKP